MKAMIFAAGLGTRLKPLTETLPKALVPVAGKPLLFHVMQRLATFGYDDFVVNVHHFPDAIIKYLKNPDVAVEGRRIAVLCFARPAAAFVMPARSLKAAAASLCIMLISFQTLTLHGSVPRPARRPSLPYL